VSRERGRRSFPGRLSAMRTHLALLAAGALLITGCQKTRNSYPSRAEAERAGAVQRGWVPAWIPDAATAIEEAHDLGTGRQRLKLRLPVPDAEALVTSLERLRVWDICPSKELPRLDGEWPKELEVAEPAWRLRYRRAPGAPGSILAVAIEEGTGAVYAWTCPELR
jgi:hypothetical protein